MDSTDKKLAEILNFFFRGHANRLKGYDEVVLTKLKERIKAFIAYELFGDSAYQKVNFGEDPNLLKAMEILQDESSEYSIKKPSSSAKGFFYVLEN